ncbi:MAG TPA: anti-sigma factor RsbA family regulatory protein [Streptosporangiaceae bacterium]|jgi:anti-sigma regulatory factor (Ser/Thr protein kinase)
MPGQGLRHAALFCRNGADYLASVTAFLGAAADRREPVLAAVPTGRLGELSHALGAAARQVTFLDMTEHGRNPAVIIPAIQAFAGQHPGERVSYLGESAWPDRTAAELVEATRHEALINLALADTPISILCPYGAGLPPTVRDDARCTHPTVIERGSSHHSSEYLGMNGLPPRCELPLAAPPADADTISYVGDLRSLRALVAAQAIGAGLSEGRAADLVLAVSELAANTLRHTSGGGTLSVWYPPGEVVCEIHDGGWISDPLAGRRRPPEHPTGRQGLWVVNQVSDLVELRSGPAGTTIRLHMSLALGPHPGAVHGGPAGLGRLTGALPAAMSASRLCPPL